MNNGASQKTCRIQFSNNAFGGKVGTDRYALLSAQPSASCTLSASVTVIN